MKVIEAFAHVTASTTRTTNAVRILRWFVLCVVLVSGELCAAVAFLCQSPAAGTVIGLGTAIPGAGAAIYGWRKSRTAPNS
ncbi:hypothetical protein [Amycolatopsis minnesotensis]|uniref:Uncharacterized protein n=1 Tax=Amycolatopsis minnesotensis TaxID=337894 RepID=A0ABN2S1R0_9PSEU